MILIKNITFLLWFYRFLFHIRDNKKRIHQFRSLGNDRAEQTEIRTAEDIWGKSLCEKAGIRILVSGLENIPDGPVVFVSNHQSYWDIPVFFSAIPHKQFGFIAKNDLEKLPAFGSWIYDVRSIFIERDDARASLRAFEEGAELLKRGFSFTIFPEGTRSKGSQMGKFKKGSLRLATKAGVPVVPITLNGSYKAFEEKGYVCPAEVNFKIHPYISTNNLSKRESGELAEHVEAIIREGLTEFISVQNN